MTVPAEQRLIDANEALIVRGELERIEQFFTADYIARSGSKAGEGHEFVRKFINQLRTALPDLKVTKIEVLNQAADTVTWQRTLTGTHQKALKGIPASGKKVSWTDMLVSRFDGERIAEDCMVSDIVGQLILKLPRP